MWVRPAAAATVAAAAAAAAAATAGYFVNFQTFFECDGPPSNGHSKTNHGGEFRIDSLNSWPGWAFRTPMGSPADTLVNI